MRTEQDLRDILLERADVSPAPDFSARVRHRITVVRRRRQATIASLGVACLAVAGVVAVPRIAPPQHHVAAPAKISLPQYDNGGKLAGSVNFLTDEKREASFTIKPTSWDIHWVTRCAPEQSIEPAHVVVLINGELATAGGCGLGASFMGPPGHAEQALTRLGVKLGQPAVITVRISGPSWGNGKPDITRYDGPMSNMRVAAGMYVGVPVDEYPFPPRPETLAPVATSHGEVIARLGPTPQLNGTMSTTFTYAEDLSLDTHSVEPGALTVLLDGQELGTWSSWDFEGSSAGIMLHKEMLAGYGIHLTPGQQVTLTVTAERFTDPDSWQVVVVRG